MQKEFTVMPEAKRKIERMYQDSMNLRDSQPNPPNADELEESYTAAYMLIYRLGDLSGFKGATQYYRGRIREAAALEPQKEQP